MGCLEQLPDARKREEHRSRDCIPADVLRDPALTGRQTSHLLNGLTPDPESQAVKNLLCVTCKHEAVDVTLYLIYILCYTKYISTKINCA